MLITTMKIISYINFKRIRDRCCVDARSELSTLYRKLTFISHPDKLGFRIDSFEHSLQEYYKNTLSAIKYTYNHDTNNTCTQN